MVNPIFLLSFFLCARYFVAQIMHAFFFFFFDLAPAGIIKLKVMENDQNPVPGHTNPRTMEKDQSQLAPEQGINNEFLRNHSSFISCCTDNG